jgi:hypothetical protein
VRRYRWSWPSIVDPQRRLARSFGATWQPAVFLVDARGRLVAGHQGRGSPAVWNRLKARLRRN